MLLWLLEYQRPKIKYQQIFSIKADMQKQATIIRQTQKDSKNMKI